MRPGKRRKTVGVVAASIVGHVAVLAALVLYVPKLRVVREPSGPPQAIIPILITPRAPPRALGEGSAPTEIRLHRRKQRFAPEAPIAPLILPEPSTAKPAAQAPVKPPAPPAPPPIVANARNALRGAIGCANARALGYTREERRQCDEQFAAGARRQPYLSTDRTLAEDTSDLGRAAARAERDRQYRQSVPLGSRGTMGGGAAEIGRSLGVDGPGYSIRP